ncbi:unnamed protein product [Didymodactylos carnosus]|uniref:Uncharacterized protein n=1 Tax=Didymodactylos carnosus TaxID=1234261 RepID=A0A814VRE3_9BILA|nr:unnamed protein product [Didymodactylos carnosus]CAF1191495.1 unnamed protein product [Didymodactylos carnosus]CAF3912972.1 unnamed protein product [Didymodactylos carnosus]CAF3955795.1 unnamed protein product [Didymodactylos carnosus]
MHQPRFLHIRNQYDELRCTAQKSRRAPSIFLGSGGSVGGFTHGNDLSGHKKQQRVSPFRIKFKEESKFPHNDVSIIKDINPKYTATQFDFLLNTENWLDRICDSQYLVELPKNIRSSYSIAVKNVPAQWNAVGFGDEPNQGIQQLLERKGFLST